MVFSSPIFLFLFLPFVLTGYQLVPTIRLKNLWLLIFSLLFYAWGEPVFILLALASTLMNYWLGRWIEGSQEVSLRKCIVGFAVALNIGLLAFFKYANFVGANLNEMLFALHLRPLSIPHVLLPIGISFFTFHALSYVVDIYRGKQNAAKNPADTALYIFFFPQLIAGPILRWSAIAPQLVHRTVTRENFAEGIRRFICGLTKKMLVANTVGLPADQIFALPSSQMTCTLAWFGVFCYTIQIYFDFSGYSDMAVGLGKLFGFQFIENFNFPYVAENVRDFWRRWHISLSSWFRDYLYIPLGGNRCSERRTYLNLVLVFFLCGLWHGASWTFVVWGLYHGSFLVLERTRFGNLVDGLPRVLRHVYTLLVVILGWVLFRSETLSQAVAVLGAMSGLTAPNGAPDPLAHYLTAQVAWSLAFGAIFAVPTWTLIKLWLRKACYLSPAAIQDQLLSCGVLVETGLLIVSLLICSAWIAGGTYNPFIYFRF